MGPQYVKVRAIKHPLNMVLYLKGHGSSVFLVLNKSKFSKTRIEHSKKLKRCCLLVEFEALQNKIKLTLFSLQVVKAVCKTLA